MKKTTTTTKNNTKADPKKTAAKAPVKKCGGKCKK